MATLFLSTSSLRHTLFSFRFSSRSSLFALSSSIPCISSNSVLFCPLHLSRSFLSPFSTPGTSRPFVCRASIPPRDSGPPPAENYTAQISGLVAFFSKLQNRGQIFVAVLFWMSLFFWTSAWDGKNGPDKGSQFRK